MKKKMLDPYRNINIRELIGLDVTVVAHTDPTLEGIKGRIIDETRNMFLVRSEEKDRKVAKKGASFELFVDGPKGDVAIILKGDELVARPEDRTKKLEKRK
ncbi:MAG: ribonuclease P protein component 1 [Thermoplasmatota archaeon]